ncbi:MAG TPA: 1-(5-phosphoribosyl)-5-[(5-phosphoribosylamino)methylideneamino]imidazole-4-carboxamide isomerase, partial [Actinomycetota bacterium]|nr:1-(5-phosphoribosyl)-5-[(5-phosphoribosylamino)methylideneamino]imidazole-4-carboxamide isomerase [Actinomycetota bacterium]
LVAVDIIEDQVVRLTRGEIQERTVYGDDPVEVAINWAKRGAEWLHVIDLDGATKGDQQNSKAMVEIIKNTSIPVQVGGGIRTVEAMSSWLDAGAARVVIGTKSEDQAFLRQAITEFGDKVVVAVDARAGRVQVGGWLEASGSSAVDAAKRAQDAGVSRIMFTDIDRDGTLMGPNLDAIEEILDAVSIPVIASGGVKNAHDVRSIAGLVGKGIEGIIIGKALYSGSLTLEEAKAAANT